MSKNGSNIAKRKAKSDAKKKKKRTLKLVKEKARQNIVEIPRPGLPYMGAPEGFRSIPFAQAMIEYSKPLIELVKPDDDIGLDNAMQIGTMLWNYSCSFEDGKPRDEQLKGSALKILKKAFELNDEAAASLITKMTERYHYLFPEEIQPKRTPFLFIRKETRHLIRPFDFSRLKLSVEVIPPDKKDEKFINNIQKLDKAIQHRKEWDDFEKLFYKVREESEERFKAWLIAKGVKDEAKDFASYPLIYLNFIYSYMHDDVVLLKSVPDIYFQEFFEDFLLRKMMVEPEEYTHWPPALKLFYLFLQEKGYLDTADDMINKIDHIEPYFLAVLKKQFS